MSAQPIDMTAPPSRLSADKGNPWFNEYWMHHAFVFLDGERIDDVITVNADDGWAERLVTPYEKTADGDLRVERIYGAFEVRANRQAQVAA